MEDHSAEDTRSAYLLEMIGNKEQSHGTGTGPMGMQKTTLRKDSDGKDLVFFNAPVSIIATILVWGLAIYCMIWPEDSKERLSGWQNSVTQWFTWAYIGSNGVWFFFVIFIYWRYGDVKLGKDDTKPEFDDANYFMMIFCAGVAVGLFFYGVSEPMYHYLEETGANRYSGAGYLNDNEKATHAINLTLYHWGVHGWVVYSLTAITLGILAFRYDLPFTYRTCFFPIFGKATWGWIGDLIDGCTIAGCIAGVCTSLGLGANSITAGMQHIGVLGASCTESVTTDCLDDAALSRTRCILIGIITLAATASVLSGLDTGIKLLSQVAFLGGMCLWTVVFVLDDTWYLLNVMVQAFGFYLQWILQLGWFTDAFGQLTWGEGRAMDAQKTWGTEEAVDSFGAHPSWMNWWTIFYWGWWISWSPFVGIFLARISKGRSVKEVINFTFSIPLLYCVLWFGTFGGAGIRMHRRAELIEQAGKDLYNNSKFFVSEKTYCFDVPAVLECPTTWTKLQGINDTDLCKKSFPYTNNAYSTNTHLSPVCKFSSAASQGYWFDLMDQNYQLGGLLNLFSIFVIIVYFVTSSDSGSLVVDFIASNGEEAHWSQRIFWASTEGILAIALLLSGGSDALGGLRSVSIVSGVALTVFCCLISHSLHVVVQLDKGEIVADQYSTWAVPLYGGIFDFIQSCITRTPTPDRSHFLGFFIGLTAPPLCLCETLRNMPVHEGRKNKGLSMQDSAVVVMAALCWLGFIVLLILAQFAVDIGLQGPAVVCYLGFVCCLCVARHEVRTLYRIEGGLMRDFLACTFLFPQAAWQAQLQVKEQVPAEFVKERAKADAIGTVEESL